MICFLLIVTLLVLSICGLYALYSKYYKNKNRGSKYSYSFTKKTFKYPRKWSKSYCLSTSCDKMGFSQKASCRPYKNCYKL